MSGVSLGDISVAWVKRQKLQQNWPICVAFTIIFLLAVYIVGSYFVLPAKYDDNEIILYPLIYVYTVTGIPITLGLWLAVPLLFLAIERKHSREKKGGGSLFILLIAVLFAGVGACPLYANIVFVAGGMEHLTTMEFSDHTYHLAQSEEWDVAAINYIVYECDSGGVVCRLNHKSRTPIHGENPTLIVSENSLFLQLFDQSILIAS